MFDFRRQLLAAAAGLALAAYGCSSPGVPQGNYGTIFGKVLNESGQPIPGAQVLVSLVIRQNTQPDGTYRVPTVPTGDQPVQASAPGYQTVSVIVKVEANKEIQQDFTLRRI